MVEKRSLLWFVTDEEIALLLRTLWQKEKHSPTAAFSMADCCIVTCSLFKMHTHTHAHTCSYVYTHTTCTCTCTHTNTSHILSLPPLLLNRITWKLLIWTAISWKHVNDIAAHVQLMWPRDLIDRPWLGKQQVQMRHTTLSTASFLSINFLKFYVT